MTERPPTSAARRPAPAKPYPSWSELLAEVGQGRPDHRGVTAPPRREWRDLVADLVADR